MNCRLFISQIFFTDPLINDAYLLILMRRPMTDIDAVFGVWSVPGCSEVTHPLVELVFR